jgi:hypothetical protein
MITYDGRSQEQIDLAHKRVNDRHIEQQKKFEKLHIKDVVDFITAELTIRLNSSGRKYSSKHVDKTIFYLQRIMGTKYNYSEMRVVELISKYPLLTEHIPKKYRTPAVELAMKLS